MNKYGRAIGYDFSNEIHEMSSFSVEEEDHPYHKDALTLNEALKEIDNWKDKYYQLMEKYLKLVDKV